MKTFSGSIVLSSDFNDPIGNRLYPPNLKDTGGPTEPNQGILGFKVVLLP